MPPKGEFEITYFGGPDNPGPCGGVNYSAPYTALPPNDLAPGSVNTQNINGFLCSSPWVGGPPFSQIFATNEYVLGVFEFYDIGLFSSSGGPVGQTSVLVVTNIAVYFGNNFSAAAVAQLPLGALTVVHTWSLSELPANTSYPYGNYPGQAISFIEVNGVVYFTGLMLTGIFAWGAINGSGFFDSFAQCTNYVSGRWIAELSGRLVVAQCQFPTGGGTGTSALPTIAWSGVGIFGQFWDGNPAHDVWNAANLNFFSGNIGGFNLLGDVPDQITGMGTVGQSIILVRNNGITQQDPNSTFSTSGVQPYNWYHMWASPQGVGGFAGTVAQFGQALTFRSSDNIYTLSLSSGLSAIGSKIIPKIISDQRTVGNGPGVNLSLNLGTVTYIFQLQWWNFASIYNVDGQLHYILTFSGYTTNPGSPSLGQNYFCYAYDLNMTDGSWHFWDFSQYYQQSASGAGFIGFSCPITQCRVFFHGGVTTGAVTTNTSPPFLFIGAVTSYGPRAGSTGVTGLVLQLVPYDYDVNSNPITNYVALLYPPLALPSTTIVFRGETLSLGHRIATRRLRLQADNAPLPTLVANAQQQAQVTVTGAGATEIQVSPVINMQGNTTKPGQPIRTYYGDQVVNSETVQPSLASIFSATNAWQTLCAFRLASVSLIGNDATGTTQ